MRFWRRSWPRTIAIVCAILVVSLALVFVAYHVATSNQYRAQNEPASPTVAHTPTPAITPTLLPSPTPSPTPLPLGHILGVDAVSASFPGVSWLRFGYPTCGPGHVSGQALRDTIQAFHSQGIRVLLTMCQSSNTSVLFDPRPLQDVAMSGADAVQCGNEQMKYDPGQTTYISPENFARFFDIIGDATDEAI
jgi:hypothetical protein